MMFIMKKRKLIITKIEHVYPAPPRTSGSPTHQSTAGETCFIRIPPRIRPTLLCPPCGTGTCSTASTDETASPNLSLRSLRSNRCSTATSTPTRTHTGYGCQLFCDATLPLVDMLGALGLTVADATERLMSGCCCLCSF